MNSEIEKLATDDIAKSDSSYINKTTLKRGSVRENFLLFNMMLNCLVRNLPLKDFINPFESCKKTDLMYRREAQLLYDLGVHSIEKYNSQVIKKICKTINDIPLPYRPYSDNRECDEVGLIRLLVKIEDIKKHLSKVYFEPDGRISFSKNILLIDDIIYQISSLLLLFKLTRFDLDSDSLYDFLIRNLDTEFVSHFAKKDGTVNQKFIMSVRACAIAIIKIQLRNHRMEHYDLGCLNLTSFACVDRIVSVVMEI